MALSPMMRQYLDIKDANKDCIVLFRLGDFYEMFFDDAICASQELELVLTGRECGCDQKAPMCGVPYHSVDAYIAKLVALGHKVAICEQVSMPEKGIADRQVVKIITPGTVMDSNMLNSDKNNYLFSIYKQDNSVGVAWADISTGEFNRCYIDAQLALKLNELLLKINPSEIICNEEMYNFSSTLSAVKYERLCKFNLADSECYTLDYAKNIILSNMKDGNEILLESEPCIYSVCALLDYILKTQKRELHYLKTYKDEVAHMSIDSSVVKTLELLQNVEGKRKGSVLWAIDKTLTGMGKRLLSKWIISPLFDANAINDRLDSVEELYKDSLLRYSVRASLSEILDIERIATRIGYGNITPPECKSLSKSLQQLPELKSYLAVYNSSILKDIYSNLETFEYVTSRIEETICNEPKKILRDGGIIKEGYDSELDGYRNILLNTRTIIANIESDEKQKTGMKNLKIKFNKVFGYFIEVPNGQSHLVPYNYIRKQTLVNAERYITEELKELEEKVLNAEDYAIKRELYLYNKLIEDISKYCDSIITASKYIAQLDVLASNAEVSAEYSYVRPEIRAKKNVLNILEGRHLIVERQKGEIFVPNDTYLDDTDNRMKLITGPNMAGKSIYLRQVALIALLAHVGFFVPAKKAEISLVDHIFTRVGASDDLHTGRSTFMVEMSEVSNIINNITDRSLLLLDELGRGTSTYDGLSIAWAVIEFILKHSKAKTLFSTHYHELTELEDTITGIKNYKMSVREINGSIAFLRKIMRGSANRSFGIEVAGIAGLPQDIIVEAKKHLHNLENNAVVCHESIPNAIGVSVEINKKQNEVMRILAEINLDDITPRNALDILIDLQEKAGDNNG